jgi:hypothetical protein
MVAGLVDVVGNYFACIVGNIGTYYFFVLQSARRFAADYPKVSIVLVI